MEQSSGKFFSKILSTSRGCPFFWKCQWKFGNFLFLVFLPDMRRSWFLKSWIVPRPKLQDGGESTLQWMQNHLPHFEPVLVWQSSTKTLGSNFLENCGLVVSNVLPFRPTRPFLLGPSSREGGWGGGGYLTKRNTGSLRPEVQPLAHLYIPFIEKRYKTL